MAEVADGAGREKDNLLSLKNATSLIHEGLRTLKSDSVSSSEKSDIDIAQKLLICKQEITCVLSFKSPESIYFFLFFFKEISQ